MAKSKKRKGWLLPATLILFILSALTLSLMAMITYAWRSEEPTHLLTFKDEQLTWDANTPVDEDGRARLSFFSTTYQNVNSENGDNVFAPGTEQLTIIRLKNDSSDTIEYTAIAWMIKESDTLPLYGGFESEGSVPTDDYAGLLPEGVTPDQLIGAVTGTVDAKGIRDFDINWYWTFYESDMQDIIDTGLGNKAAWETADDAVIGFAIIVEGETPVPPPPTGHQTWMWWGVGLVGACGALLVVELILNAKRKKKEKKDSDGDK